MSSSAIAAWRALLDDIESSADKPYASRATVRALNERFQALLARAEKQGIAVAIGHPYPETVDYLLEALPLLPELGMELVFASEALQTEAAIKLAQIDTDLTASAAPGC